jgi:hypothetical protein
MARRVARVTTTSLEAWTDPSSRSAITQALKSQLVDHLVAEFGIVAALDVPQVRSTRGVGTHEVGFEPQPLGESVLVEVFVRLERAGVVNGRRL